MEKKLIISPDSSIKDALKKLDRTAEKTLFVVDESGVLLGSLTDGDIRRYILKTGKIDGFVWDVCNKNPIAIEKDDLSDNKIKELFLKKKIEVLPVVDGNGRVIDCLTWTDVFSEKQTSQRKRIVDVPVVIMAGGKGTRLAPFTQVLPKPLIPIGEKTMIEHIIDNFRLFGVDEFYVTVNYKGELLEAYFNGIKRDYDVKFVWEKDFLGTAGSLKLLESELKGDFIVSNCDILIKADFSDVLDFHRRMKSSFTSITSIQNYRIPYGVVKIKHGGFIDSIIEKPEYTFQINTGVYVLNSKVLENIPKNEPFDMPELINALLKNNEGVYAYPVSEGDYIDIGQWEEYRKALKKLQGNILDV